MYDDDGRNLMSSRSRDRLLVPGRESRRACSIISSGLDPTIIIPKPDQIMFAYEYVHAKTTHLVFPGKFDSSQESHADDLQDLLSPGARERVVQ